LPELFTTSPVASWLNNFDPSTGNGTFKQTTEGWITTPYLTGLAAYYPGQGARPIVWADAFGTNIQSWDNDSTDGVSIKSSDGTTRLVVNNSGNVYINTISQVGYNNEGVLQIVGKSANTAMKIRNGSDAQRVLHFFNASNSAVGDITCSSSSTTYNTSSDYRLKENVAPMVNSIDRLKELKPSRFNFKVDADITVDGFLAHEVSDFVPEAISGEKDAMRTEEYEVSPALGDVFTPAVEAIEEVTETVVISQAIEAVDAVMGERQVTETLETGTYVNLAGETITETSEVGVTEEATETVVERQDIEGVMTEVEVERIVQVAVMETYEVSPAIEAATEVTEVNIITEAVEAVAEVILESNVEKPENGTWRETTEQVMAEREVPDMQGIDQGKLVPLLVAALQEAIARIEVLEA